MRKSLLNLLIIFLMLNTFANLSANTYYVSTAGDDAGDGSVSNPFKTIAKAASLLNPGDTVLVSGGNYPEKNIIPKTSGTENAMIVFKPVPSSGTVVISHPATSIDDNTPIFELSNRSFIWIEGFHFKNFLYGKASISISNGKDNVVINNRFENLGNSQVQGWAGNSVIWVYKSTGNVVRNNYFKNITGDGISLNSDARYNLISDNTFTNFFGKLRDWGGSGLFSRAIDIQDETYGNNVITFNYGEQLKNFIWLDRDGSSNVMLRNVARNSSGLVFNESRCANNLVQENIAYSCQTAYQTARYSGTGRTLDARWINNIAYNNSTGFYIDRSMRDELRNNIAYNNTSYNIEYTDSAQGFGPHIFQNNLWFTLNKTNSVRLGNTAVSVAQFQSDADVNETGGLSVNPLFTSTTSGSEDFTLQPSSPAKNTGDMGVDMGAYAVYGKTSVGWDSLLQISDVQVYFDSAVSVTKRGTQIQLGLRLSRASSEQINVDITPVAGDARNVEDFVFENQTVTFEPYETSKTLSITIGENSEHDELVAFRLTNITNAQAGSRNLSLLKILGPPKLIALAGFDKTVSDIDNSGSEPVILDGSGSFDSDGTITSYVWSEGGTQIATGVKPSVNLTQGVHTITLTITDNDGNTDTDEIIVTVIVYSQVWLEAECGKVGSLFNITTDANASNSKFVTVIPGNNSSASAPADSTGWITFQFTIGQAGTHYLMTRVMCPDANGDSFWLKMDNGSFVMWNGISNSSSWIWATYTSTFNLSAGDHILTIAYREDDAKLDKVLITNNNTVPSGLGSAAGNCGVSVKSVMDVEKNIIYPNPVMETLNIALSGFPSIISLYNSSGLLLLDLNTNNNNASIDMTKYLAGIYFVKINYSQGKTIVKKIIKL